MKPTSKRKYTKEEREELKLLEDTFEERYAKRLKNMDKHRKDLSEAARRTFEGTQQISLRVNKHSLQKFKAQALREGIPYQTLINSLIHKYVA